MVAAHISRSTIFQTSNHGTKCVPERVEPTRPDWDDFFFLARGKSFFFLHSGFPAVSSSFLTVSLHSAFFASQCLETIIEQVNDFFLSLPTFSFMF